ncbi:MAG TPA: LptF/LptG family permease [Tepidisphaeraceae bacterium]|jgi:lipopolysaccharide export LptBFGC system permease protein LptF|nr:LptF/LptG family permease [Tepidisphaeraceae bacterium]
MRRTLFWYVFKDLLRIFFLTSGALAGIMSFGGLLRPLTENGLDVKQVMAILRYSMPAMTTYSLPIAALFATTVVYGRLAADNEITAMRAAGIGYNPFTGIASPALWLGLSISLLSLLLLCFIVPVFMLKVERVIFSNVGQIICNEIAKNHQLKFNQGDMDVTVYSHAATMEPADSKNPNLQVVTLVSPMVVTYQSVNKKNEDKPKIPKDFFMSSFANISIERNEKTDEIYVNVQANGTKFPRNFAGGEQMGVSSGAVMGLTYPSPVRENTKFMDIFRLRYLLKDPSDSRRVKEVLRGFIRADQQGTYLEDLLNDLNKDGEVKLASETEAFTLERGNAAGAINRDHTQVNLTSPAGQRDIRFDQAKGNVHVDSGKARFTVVPDADKQRLGVSITLEDAMVKVGTDEVASPRDAFRRDINLPMPDGIETIENRTLADYTKAGSILPDRQRQLYRVGLQLTNSITSELHSRISFALSCLVLVLVGCMLGMLFRSGNFLTAFAVSVVPALISIALIITGQHTCENIPQAHQLTANFTNPLNLGLTLIWTGNAAVAAIAVLLWAKLKAQ